MNQKETIKAVQNSMYHQIRNTGYATAVQVIMDLNILTNADYEKWRLGQVSHLERVCSGNLNRLALILRTMKEYGKAQGCKESVTDYKKWGKKGKFKLRFSKYGKENVERRYATHYVKT